MYLHAAELLICGLIWLQFKFDDKQGRVAECI